MNMGNEMIMMSDENEKLKQKICWLQSKNEFAYQQIASYESIPGINEARALLADQIKTNEELNLKCFELNSQLDALTLQNRTLIEKLD